MECNNCGNQEAHISRVCFDKKLGRLESCNLCGDISSSDVYMPDVFWNGPGYHPGLVDKNNKPIFLYSRRQKARLMKEQNSREAGDWHHGTRGTEGLYVPRGTKAPNEKVLQLKKIFQEHEKQRGNYGR